MACTVIPLGEPGSFAIACTRGRKKKSDPRCSRCGRPAGLLCDGAVTPARREGEELVPFYEDARSCDAPICALCATRVAKNVDLCPRCAGKVPAGAPTPIAPGRR